MKNRWRNTSHHSVCYSQDSKQKRQFRFKDACISHALQRCALCRCLLIFRQLKIIFIFSRCTVGLTKTYRRFLPKICLASKEFVGSSAAVRSWLVICLWSLVLRSSSVNSYVDRYLFNSVDSGILLESLQNVFAKSQLTAPKINSHNLQLGFPTASFLLLMYCIVVSYLKLPITIQ